MLRACRHSSVRTTVAAGHPTLDSVLHAPAAGASLSAA
jgi:hypothetical protein